MIEIIETGPFNTVQDLGRPGYRKIGVTASGAMDPFGLKIGNVLVGNAPGAAAIEVQTFPFRLRFTGPVVFTVTGADCGAKLDEHPLLPWCTHAADAGQALELGRPRTGARAYLCFAGGLDVEPVMGSRSTSLRGAFGGNGGRFLTATDRLALCAETSGHRPRAGISVVDPAFALADHLPTSDDGSLIIRALPAGEHDLFGNDAERFWTQIWQISSKSDRTGYRLSGEPVKPTTPVEMRSHGVVPGVIQVPPSGEPIVQMSDANTAGGYPKIAGVIDADLWRLGQARIGSRVRFVRATHREALDVEKAMTLFLDDVRVTCGMVTRALNTMA
ncbi:MULTISPECIES: biotin-dependent carboxyltransferase family protein [unclassified Sinorhizobium]|uniref:5-oxoprolinase subunit C family protein n=1 Tax=unclassified Sinorhizobium TaxID=2613772 RepID=UPI0024C3601B|nr:MULTISPECIES: biotin-dependent carboxyltransferase family protein [unclassified Sinorhizobium]MDK1377597.1 biotin-dependent carboxyltransferase family protein [Sinorhizobium sp. 6-70]MDK1480967.1 biotin-dependent carboxyltransferase family protein [Sinorhizobium sp. 6-117]